MDVEGWKNKTKELTIKINSLVNEFNAILEDWADVRDAAGDPGKHLVDRCFTELSNARATLCSLKGGKRSRKHRRTRKHRR